MGLVCTTCEKIAKECRRFPARYVNLLVLPLAIKERTMPVRLCRWGNSLGLRISSYIVHCAHLKSGDFMEIRILDNGDIVIRPVKPRNGGGSIARVDDPPKESTVKNDVPDKW